MSSRVTIFSSRPHGDKFLGFFKRITTPALRELSVSVKYIGPAISSVVSSAVRSSSTLQRLSLSGDTVQEDELFGLFLSISALRELKLVQESDK